MTYVTQTQHNPINPQRNIGHGLKPLIITLHGIDRSGVSAALFRVLAAHAVQVVDVEQSKFRGYLNLAVYAAAEPERIEVLSQGLESTLSSYGIQPIVEMATDGEQARPRSTHVLVVLGNPIPARALHRIGQTLADYDANIDTIRGIADYPLTGLEIKITTANPTAGSTKPLRKALASLSSELGVDIAVERAGLLRRAKRLVCFDCDSTLIKGEVIEMLAAHAGREAEVAAVTERAMRGELDFENSLRQRVAALAGLPESVIQEVAQSIQLTPGARTTIRTLQRLGYHTAVVSGGFTQVLEPLAESLQLDHMRANTLEIKDGKLTGRVIGEIVDRAKKADYLAEFAQSHGVAMHQTVAVGDGANDIDMLSIAGLGIAFNAKNALKEVADAQVNTPYLDEVLYMLGITRAEIEAADHE